MLHFKFPLRPGSKRTIRKTVEARGDLMDNKITDKIARTGSWSTSETTSQALQNSLEMPKGNVHITWKRQQVIDKLRLI